MTGDGARRDADGYYWITGRVDDAEKAYTEALAINRELAVDNPGVYAKRVTSLHAELARLNEGLKAGSAGTK